MQKYLRDFAVGNDDQATRFWQYFHSKFKMEKKYNIVQKPM